MVRPEQRVINLVDESLDKPDAMTFLIATLVVTMQDIAMSLDTLLDIAQKKETADRLHDR